MAYTTEAKVIVLLTGITSVNAQFIAMADSIINAKLASRYTVPFTTTPPLIETISTDLAAYYVMRTNFTADSQNESEWVKQYKEIMKMLDEIVEGKMPLIDSSGAEMARVSDTIYSSTKDYTPTFDVDEIENAIVDSDRLDDISSSRE